MTREKEKKSNDDAEVFSEPVSSEHKSRKALKPSPKVAKKSTNNLVIANKSKGTPEIQGTESNKKQKRVSEGFKESGPSEKGFEKTLNTREMKQKDIVDENYSEKSQQSSNTNEKLGMLQKKQLEPKNNETHGALGKNKQMQMNKEKNEQEENKKEGLGGIIFMCNAKTKPDCFRYQVMGVTMSRKDLVLGVKPGLPLFLYDFDLKVMYGIYKASSCGGLKLEPTAFGGAFPVQVRFNIEQDCSPLPESAFRKAIKENYDEKNKFKTELSVIQVKNLEKLFRIRTNAAATQLHPTVTVGDGEVQERARESRHQSNMESVDRDVHTNNDVRRHSVLYPEDNQHLIHRGVPSIEKDGIHQGSFLNEQEYRTYGLRRERPNLAPLLSYTSPALEPFPEGHMKEDLMRQPSNVYIAIDPPPGEPINPDPDFATERNYQTYGVGARRALQQAIPTVTTGASHQDNYRNHSHYASNFGASYVEQFPTHSRMKEFPSGSYSLGGSGGSYRTETDDIQMREAYNQRHLHKEARPDSLDAPVSSRYSFAGPSFSHR